jgi:hypothetical protein
MASQNSNNGTSPEELSNSRKIGCYSHCQSRKRTPSAKESRSHCPHPTTPPAQSQPRGTFTNSVQAAPHWSLSSPAPQEMAQEAKHSHVNTWSSTYGNCWDSSESGEHARDTSSEGVQQPRPTQRGWPITKCNSSADGHQTRTKPISTTTPSKSSKLLAASQTHQNTLHNTPSTSFGGCRRSWESPGGAAATAAASAPPRRHLCFARRLLFRSGLISCDGSSVGMVLYTRK